ncbi:hypothetical protein ABFX02_10G016900 [Erythranthe guttata]
MKFSIFCSCFASNSKKGPEMRSTSPVVNPPKDETVKIRKLLEKFGSVGEANVFYWFQNRSSRSRQMQATLSGSVGGGGELQHQGHPHVGGNIFYEYSGGGIDYESFWMISSCSSVIRVRFEIYDPNPVFFLCRRRF